MCSGHIELDLGSSMEVVDAVQTAAEVHASGQGLDGDRAHFIAVALREALVNAIKHGHHGNPNRRIKVHFCTDSRKNLVYTVRDGGSGFDLNRIPDPLTPENLSRGSGRGVFYMRQFADRVQFTFPEEGGTVVRLEKRLPQRKSR